MITERIDHTLLRADANRGRYPWLIVRKQLRTDFILFV